MIVGSFGVHVAGGIPFLLQASGPSNLISPELRCPLQIQLPRRRVRCPHQIDLDTLADPPDWLGDPLAAACLPTPRSPGEKVKVLLDPDGAAEGLIRQLCRMSSPTQSLFYPIWWRLATQAQVHYQVTNLTPVIWTSAEVRHCKTIGQHMSYAEAFNRRVLILAKERLPLFGEVDWITTELNELDVSSCQLEAIGAGEIYRYMDNV